MSQALSRKYRPQTFEEVVGQNHIKITLQNEILSGQIAAAYLFTGPRGIGKTSLARILAKALNCQTRKKNEFEPCNLCQSCQEITSGRSLDLIEIDAATHTQVDKVRENIVANVNFPPHHQYKIFIIDEVHMLSTPSFNALLKTLEEPPSFVVFILCTTEAYKLPETVVSRCQRFDFKKVSAEQIINKLKKIATEEKIKIREEVLATIALRSGGFFRDAEGLLGQVFGLFGPDQKEITLDEVTAILPRADFEALAELSSTIIAHDARRGVELINKLLTEGIDLERFNLDLIDFWRQMILIKLGLKNTEGLIAALPEEVENKLIGSVGEVSLTRLIKILEKFMSIQNALKEAEITQLPLELAIVELGEEEENIKALLPETPAYLPRPASLLQKPGERLAEAEKHGSTDNTKIRKYEKTENTLDSSTYGNESHSSPPPLTKGGLRGVTYNNSINFINIETIKTAWPEIVRASQKLNHSLTLILKAAYPIAVSNNHLELGFEFEIHLKKIKEEKCLRSLEEILEKILNAKIVIKPVLLTQEGLKDLKQERQSVLKNSDGTKNSTLGNVEDNIQLADILNSFGGKVIE